MWESVFESLSRLSDLVGLSAQARYNRSAWLTVVLLLAMVSGALGMFFVAVRALNHAH